MSLVSRNVQQKKEWSFAENVNPDNDSVMLQDMDIYGKLFRV